MTRGCEHFSRTPWRRRCGTPGHASMREAGEAKSPTAQALRWTCHGRWQESLGSDIVSLPELTSAAEWPWRKVLGRWCLNVSADRRRRREGEGGGAGGSTAHLPAEPLGQAWSPAKPSSAGSGSTFCGSSASSPPKEWQPALAFSVAGLLQKVCDVLKNRAELERKYSESLLNLAETCNPEPGLGT